MSQEIQWSNPVITQLQNVQFPIESAPHYLADLCKAIALEVQVPIELPYFAAVSVLAAATNGKIEVVVKGRYKEQLSFYNIIGFFPSFKRFRKLYLPKIKYFIIFIKYFYL
jgi:hypothetical protein